MTRPPDPAVERPADQPGDRPADRPGDRLGTSDLLQAAARAMRRTSMQVLAEYDVTPSQVRALRVVLATEECPRLSDVAGQLRVAPRTATEVVDALEQRDLVRREPDPADRRATRLRATDDGRRLGEVLAASREQAGGRFLGRLDEADRAELHRILALLVEDEG